MGHGIIPHLCILLTSSNGQSYGTPGYEDARMPGPVALKPMHLLVDSRHCHPLDKLWASGSEGCGL